ncbi:hypothetical protein ACE193_09750 [Bernardetia sp. OM2101]|uniref:hypothetical protein n=1 Tax=Bernardetia sp. OM2101 TaxID=3344876 RepID=UPI0035CFBB11
MIYINLDDFQPDEKWRWKANWHTMNMSDLSTIAEMKAYITNIWSEIKNDILLIPNANKCWFSEAKDVVSDYHIEHFRPKKEVTKFDKSVPHIEFQEEQRSQWTTTNNKADGYFWLAFDYKNYRISGGKINSSFKKNLFPIRFASHFIAENRNQDYKFEEIVLLDPTKRDDPELLTFEANGNAIPTYWHDIDQWKYTRAVVSIIIYGLNDIDDLVNARLKKWDICRILIEETQRKHQMRENLIAKIDWGNEKEVLMFGELEETLKINYQKLKDEIAPFSHFSSVAMACVKSYNYEWIQDYVFA